jgi:cell pole-organizing protein PopZ
VMAVIHQLIEPAPEGFNVSREAWAAISAAVRAEIVRCITEITRAFVEMAIEAGHIPADSLDEMARVMLLPDFEYSHNRLETLKRAAAIVGQCK